MNVFMPSVSRLVSTASIHSIRNPLFSELRGLSGTAKVKATAAKTAKSSDTSSITKPKKSKKTSSPPLATINDCKAYLKHCKRNEVSLTSTVFRGTLYEYTAKDFLEEKLRCFELVRKGGSFDNGVDLVGKWDLYYFFKLNESVIKQQKLTGRASSQSINPIIKNSIEWNHLQNKASKKNSLSMKTDINILVQCKNYTTKIQASTIRELVGIYLQHIKTEIEKNSTFMLLVSPSPLTKQAQSIIDQTSIPLIHIILSPLMPINREKNVYNLNNWDGGSIDSVYLNSYSKILLKYLNIELELQKLKSFILVE